MPSQNSPDNTAASPRRMMPTSALFEAIARADLLAARDCVWQGADLNARIDPGGNARKDFGRTPLLRACAELLCDEVAADFIALLLPQSDPLARDQQGKSPLIHAATSGFPKSLALLLPHSDPGQTSDDGRTALMQAAWRGARECARLLIPVSPHSAQDAEGHDALMIAVLSDSPECIPLLLPHADLTARAHNGLTAFELARKSGSQKVWDLMLCAQEAASLDQTLPRPSGAQKPRGL